MRNYNFNFALNETKEIREKICSDIDKIVSYLEGLISGCAVGLWGSFSFGEGRVKEVNNKLEYVDDLDFVVYTNSIVKFFKWNNNKTLKNLNEKLNINAEICVWVKCIPLIKLRLFFCGFPRILNKKGVNIFKEKNIPTIHVYSTYLLKSYYRLFKYVLTNEKHFLRKAYIEVFRSLVFSKKRDKDTFSLKHNLNQLNEYKKILTKEQYRIIECSIESRLSLKTKSEIGYDSISKMKPLYDKLFNKYYRTTSTFSMKYYFKLIKFLLQEKKIPNIFINFSKKRFLIHHYLLQALEKNKKINESYLKKAEDTIKKMCYETNQYKSLEERFSWCIKNLEYIWR
ncbi:MAG: hypothetical protein H8D38_06120 [DPANN group archaeon]|nr:hypothetical protein [DPANN group archaeon]